MPGIYRSMFAINDITNGTLKAVHAMPQKDSTSDGTDSFAMDRFVYFQTLQPANSITNKQQLHKKWFQNRDASSVTRNRRIAEVGVGTMNASNTPFSFTTNKDVNVVNQARHRVRSGGAVAPLKKNAMKTNAPTPSWTVGKLIRTQYRSVQHVQPKTAMFGKPVNKNVKEVFL